MRVAQILAVLKSCEVLPASIACALGLLYNFSLRVRASTEAGLFCQKNCRVNA
jgi:hypothetical protein